MVSNTPRIKPQDPLVSAVWRMQPGCIRKRSRCPRAYLPGLGDRGQHDGKEVLQVAAGQCAKGKAGGQLEIVLAAAATGLALLQMRKGGGVRRGQPTSEGGASPRCQAGGRPILLN